MVGANWYVFKHEASLVCFSNLFDWCQQTKCLVSRELFPVDLNLEIRSNTWDIFYYCPMRLKWRREATAKVLSVWNMSDRHGNTPTGIIPRIKCKEQGREVEGRGEFFLFFLETLCWGEGVGWEGWRGHSPERQHALKPHCRFWQPLALSAWGPGEKHHMVVIKWTAGLA